MRIIVTSDLHVEFMNRKQVAKAVATMSALSPDLLIHAGDLGRGEREWQTGLDLLDQIPAPRRALLAGNHDLWCLNWTGEITSTGIFREKLPEIAARRGWTWLEDQTIRVGRTAIVGSVAWYDYSSHPDPTVPKEEIRRVKGRYNNDGNYLSVEWDDLAVAEECRAGLVRRFEAAEADPEVDHIVVVTHVPIFPETRVSEPRDVPYADAYFHNYTIGKEVIRFRKVVEVVSGHTHRRADAVIERPDAPSIRARIVPSDYGRLEYVVVEVPE